jgi:hypothetical protein
MSALIRDSSLRLGMTQVSRADLGGKRRSKVRE